uniref:CD320 molecule n=1 Tax=Monodelphis domestica TaxID=13616 RepID=A0A5F8GZ67_MONDO
MAGVLLRLLPLLMAGLERALALSLAQPRSLAHGEGTEQPCPPSKFSCGAGICIPSEWLCDGDRDCPDGRDETSCWAEPCAHGEERCPSETCFPVRCEGPECAVLWTQARCPPPPCLAKHRFCDGVSDCPNGTDEQFVDCKKHRLKPSSLDCAKEGFQCAPGVCIPHAWVCDGHSDCASGNDEHHCGVTQIPGDQNTTSAVSLTSVYGNLTTSERQSAYDLVTAAGVTQAPRDQNTTSAMSLTPGHGNLTPSERRSAYGLVMAAAALSGVLAAACLLVCCQTWAQVRWRLLPQPNLLEAVKESLLIPERTPSPLL